MTETTCDRCGGPNGMFIYENVNVCRWCHPEFPPATRAALNNLKAAGLI